MSYMSYMSLLWSTALVRRYRTEMKDQFTVCQDAEQKRIDFFKVLMTDYLRVLRVDHSNAYVTLQTTIESINADADIVKYSETHGVGMPLEVPQFTAYDDTDQPAPASRSNSIRYAGMILH